MGHFEESNSKLHNGMLLLGQTFHIKFWILYRVSAFKQGQMRSSAKLPNQPEYQSVEIFTVHHIVYNVLYFLLSSYLTAFVQHYEEALL